MTARSLNALLATAGTLAMFVAAPRAAWALQPLDVFLRSASSQNVDNREAALTLAQRSYETNQARFRLLPYFTASAAYTRNQYEVDATFPVFPAPAGQPPPTRTAVITPQDQYDVQLRVDVPIVDVAAWRRVGVAEQTQSGARVRIAATDLDVQRQVARSYYQLAGAVALVESAQQALAASQDSAGVVHARHDAGLASDLDVERATAEVERSRQSVAEAELSVALANRALETLSGLAPQLADAHLPNDLSDEAPLPYWEHSVRQLPSVQAADADVRSQQAAAGAAWLGYLPVIGAFGVERFTNAVGFGQSPYWALGVLLTWRLDFVTYETSRVQTLAAQVLAVREQRAFQIARDAIENDWQQVRSYTVRSTAARAQLVASRHAASLARDRYGNGTATHLDVVQADRDAFAADVSRIQADADLAYARALLRIDSGRSLSSAGQR